MTRFFSYTRLAPTSAMPAPAATVTVYNVGTLTLASIFDDDTGTPKSNPFTADASGYFYFYAADGRYDVRFSGGGIASPFTWGDVFVGGDSGAIPINSEAALLAALTTIGGSNATLLISSNVAISASVTIPTNVSLWFISPGKFTIASGQTVTIAGAIIADRHQLWAGAGSVDLTDAKLDWVYPEWWGAVALKAASGTPADSTTAILAAFNSRRNVLFDQGIYGVDTTATSPRINTDGQWVRGQGMSVVVDGQGGTILKRLAGTNPVIIGGSFIGITLGGLVIDGGGFDGHGIQWQPLYGIGEPLRVRNIGGTSYAFFLTSTNLSNLYGWFAEDSCYGAFKTDPSNQALYTRLWGCGCGTTQGGKALDIENTAGLTIVGGYFDGPIDIHGINQSTHFTDTNLEVANITSEAAITIRGTDCLNTVFRGLRIYRAVANNSYPEISISGGAKSTHLADVYYNDLVSSAGKVVIELDNAPFTRIDNIETYVANALDLIKCANNRSDDISFSSVFAHSGAIPRLNLWTARCTIEDSNCNVSFNAASESVIFQTVSGAITQTNLTYPIRINSGSDTLFTFADGDTTPSIARGSFFATANTGATTITDFDDAVNSTGQEFFLRFDDANTTLDLSGNANMVGNGGVDFTGAVNDWARATSVGGVWFVEVFEA